MKYESRTAVGRRYERPVIREILTAGRFGIVGVAATAVHMLIVGLLVKFTSLPVLLSNLCAFLTAFSVSFSGNYLWTFGAPGKARVAMGRFFLVSGSAFAVNTVVLAFLIRILGFSREVAVISAAAVIPLFTYLASRMWVFPNAQPTAINSEAVPRGWFDRMIPELSDSWLLGYCFVGGFVIFSPVVGLVFPELAYYYKLYGNMGRPDLVMVLKSFVSLAQDWYRPVSFFVAPYFFGTNVLNPSGVAVLNIVFFAITAYVVPTVFLPRSPFTVKLIVSSLILSAPALQAVAYFAVIDPLYILFGIGVVLLLDKAFAEKARFFSWRYFGAVLALFLAAASKEVAVLTPFLAVPILFLRRIKSAEESPSWDLAVKIVRYCMPLAVASVAYYLIYVYLRGAVTSSETYSSVPSSNSISKIPRFFLASLNIEFPAAWNDWLAAATGDYDVTASTLRIGIYVLAAGIWLLAIRRASLWSAGAVLAALAVLVIPLGIFHLHPHHAFPVIIMIAVAVGSSFSILAGPSTSLSLSSRIQTSITVQGFLVLASFLLMYRGYVFNTRILDLGYHAWPLRYNTELFNDSLLRAKLDERPSYLLMEECPSAWEVGAFSGVVQYFGRSRTSLGEEYVKLGSLQSVAAERLASVEAKGTRLIGLACKLGEPKPYEIRVFAE